MRPFIEAAIPTGHVIASSGVIIGIIWSVMIAYRGRRFVRNVYREGDD